MRFHPKGHQEHPRST